MWIMLSLATMGLFAILLLLIVPLSRAGVDPAVVLFYSFAGGCLLDFAYLTLQGTPLRIPAVPLWWNCLRRSLKCLWELVHLEGDESCAEPGVSCCR